MDNNTSDMTDYSEGILSRWKQAVIHIECAPNREAIAARDQKMQEALQASRKGEIDEEELVGRISSLGRRQIQRATGTALFMKDGDHHFLLTARRVVETASQTQSILRDRLQGSQRLRERQGPLSGSAEREISRARKTVDRRVAGAIARVPTFDDIYEGRLEPGTGSTTLTGLNKNVYEEGPFSFSEDTDLAVISLDREQTFLRRIKELGHLPVSREDITEEPSGPGAPLFTVGYPFPMSIVDREHQGRIQPSMIFGEPTFTFGRTSMIHSRLRYFWADMNMYSGHNGGPVIEGGKLVGIISGKVSSPVEATASADDTPSDRRRGLPFDRISKARFVGMLIKEQLTKQNN